MDDVIRFDKGKPFYEMVGTFMAALSASSAIFNADNPMGYTKDQYIVLTAVQLEPKHLYPLEVYEQAKEGHMTRPFFVGHLCMMLANLAYEAVKEKNDHSPEFELFRHVRNAASHQNKFVFGNAEPRRPAAWRGVLLDHSLKGAANPLHGQMCFGPVLGPGDIVQLLWDIEARVAAQPS